MNDKEVTEEALGLLGYILRNIKQYDELTQMQIIHFLMQLLREVYIEKRIEFELKRRKKKKKVAVMTK